MRTLPNGRDRGLFPRNSLPGAWCGSTYTSNGPARNRHAPREILSYRILLETRHLDIGQAGGTMIPSLETEHFGPSFLRHDRSQPLQALHPSRLHSFGIWSAQHGGAQYLRAHFHSRFARVLGECDGVEQFE